jgi:hypothetical protein
LNEKFGYLIGVDTSKFKVEINNLNEWFLMVIHACKTGKKTKSGRITEVIFYFEMLKRILAKYFANDN